MHPWDSNSTLRHLFINKFQCVLFKTITRGSANFFLGQISQFRQYLDLFLFSFKQIKVEVNKTQFKLLLILLIDKNKNNLFKIL